MVLKARSVDIKSGSPNDAVNLVLLPINNDSLLGNLLDTLRNRGVHEGDGRAVEGLEVGVGVGRALAHFCESKEMESAPSLTSKEVNGRKQLTLVVPRLQELGGLLVLDDLVNTAADLKNNG